MFGNIEEIKQAIQNICEEKNISIESVIEGIEAALAAAFRKDFGDKNQNLKAKFNIETGDVEIYDIKTVVEDRDVEKENEEYMKIKESLKEGEEMPENIKRFNPKTEIMLSDAKEHNKKLKLGDELIIKLEIPDDFGRVAAQTAKQVIIQKIREAERETIISEFQGKEGEVVNTTVQRREGPNIIVDLNRATGVLPQEEQVRTDNYSIGSRLKVIILKTEDTPRGPRIVVSRAHPEIINKIFTIEVPEIANGIVEIKAISRDPGFRTKIAVSSNQENIDPVGSCVGQKGSRVQTIIAELGGEKIDIIEWNSDPLTFIKNALSPAKILNIELNKDEKTAIVKVEEDQLSLAIGKEGQNVKLAAKLTGWKIDIEGAEKFITPNKDEKNESEIQVDEKADVDEKAEKKSNKKKKKE